MLKSKRPSKKFEEEKEVLQTEFFLVICVFSYYQRFFSVITSVKYCKQAKHFPSNLSCSMSNLKYFYDLMSQPSRALYIFLKLTDIPFEPCSVALRKGIQHSDEFKDKLNRFQKVPFIHHGDFKLSESIAIVRYLAKEYRDMVPNHWYPDNSQEQAKVDEYLEWQHFNTRMACSLYFIHKWLIPNMTGSPPDEDEIEKHKSKMLTCLDEIEELWLSQGHKFIASDQISIADIFAACELEQPKMGGFDVTEGRPKLKAYMKLVREACNPYYDEAHVFVNKVANKTRAAKL